MPSFTAGIAFVLYTAPAVTVTATSTVMTVGTPRVHYLAPDVAVNVPEVAGAATRQNPDVWIHLRMESAGSPVTVTHRYFSARPLADPSTYYGGWKEGRVIAGGFGPIIRNLSTIEGSYSVDTWSVELDDTDGAVRALLTEEGTEVELRWEVAVYFISEVGRKAANTPRTLFRGQVERAQDLDGRRVRLDCKDLLGADLKGFDLDAEVPQGTWGDDFTADDVPDEVKAATPALVVGECSDYGALDVDGNAADVGLIPVKYLGRKLISEGYPGTPPDAPTYLEPPALSVVTFNDGGSTHTVRCGVTALTHFGETTLSNIVTVANYPKNPGPPDDPDRGAHWYITPPSANADEIIAYRLYVIDGSSGSPKFRMDELNNNGTYEDPETSYTDDGDDSHTKPFYPPPPSTNKAQVAVGDPGVPGSGPMYWYRFGVCRGYIPIHEADVGIYASNVAQGDQPQRTLMESAVRGLDFILPGDTEWPEDNNWISQGGRRYTGFYGRGPRADHHIDGRVAIALNACGYTAAANGTGLLIDQAFYACQHLLEEFFGLQEDGAVYEDESNWLGLPYFNDGTTPKLQPTAFARAQAQSAVRLGTAKGYLARFVLDEKLTLREFLRQFALSFNCFWRVNRHGQLGPVLINHGQHPNAGRLFRDRIEIKRWHTPEIDTRVCNVLTYRYDYNSEAKRWRLPDETLRDETLITAYRGVRERDVLELRMVGDAATARNVARHWFDLYKHKRRFVKFDLRYQGLELDLGDPVRWTHYDGLGQTGETNTRGVVFGHAVDLNSDTVQATGLDTSNLTPQGEGDPETAELVA